ncbi:MAG: DUF1315 family protein [Proteobacteria bacterium]|jgi:uncharacterized protein|nr:DUF1315 family protein [Pseudomonadota bacterium]MDA1350961.1 DUF1315 family protein [Pseudomonadota bacterium]|tara:strand:- start:3920 stop:4165 length:246 start_codon:yes stop_codon:yes gene_type:complete
MDLRQLLSSITPEVYESLRRAVEVGKWPDRRSLSDEQKSLCMQAVIAYEESMPEQQRTGYVPPKNTACEPSDGEQALVWKE